MIVCGATIINHYLDQLSQVFAEERHHWLVFKKGIECPGDSHVDLQLGQDECGSFRAASVVTKDAVSQGYRGLFFYSPYP